MIPPGGICDGLHEATERGGRQPAEATAAIAGGPVLALDLRGAQLEQGNELAGAHEGTAEGAAAAEREDGARNAGHLGHESGPERHRRGVERGEGGESGTISVGGAPDHDLAWLLGARLLRAREAPNRRRLGLQITLMEGCQLCL